MHICMLRKLVGIQNLNHAVWAEIAGKQDQVPPVNRIGRGWNNQPFQAGLVRGLPYDL